MDAALNKRAADAPQCIVCTLLAFLLALWGPSARNIEEARADEPREASAEAARDIDNEACVLGQAIACVVPGRETQLAREYDSVELLLKIDAQSSNCGSCDLVLVRSSSQAVEELVAELEASEGVVFAEPNYLEGLRAENDPEEPAEQGDGQELRANGVEQRENNSAELDLSLRH